MPDVYLRQSDTNLALNITQSGEIIVLSNTSEGDLSLKTISIRYDSSVPGIELLKFQFIRAKSSNDLNLCLGNLILGAEGNPMGLSRERIIEVKSNIIIPKSQGISFFVSACPINLPPGKIFMSVEWESPLLGD
ncbi:MAG: hypothetical protein H7A25_18530 [Leptospiraceae bacterium]|nr:hypothetical protein [Leptospiraceae bacterium]MCP5501904.1 hypothetical protein [Leptospiraceae bacterium]